MVIIVIIVNIVNMVRIVTMDRDRIDRGLF